MSGFFCTALAANAPADPDSGIMGVLLQAKLYHYFVDIVYGRFKYMHLGRKQRGEKTSELIIAKRSQFVLGLNVVILVLMFLAGKLGEGDALAATICYMILNYVIIEPLETFLIYMLLGRKFMDRFDDGCNGVHDFIYCTCLAPQ